MEEDNKYQHFSKNVVSYISGSILFTAPHSKGLKRGGEKYKFEKQQIHKKQLLVQYICPQLARWSGYNSFCFWGKSFQLSQEDLDPNFLLPQMFQKSPFHQCLHYWAKKVQQQPLLHVDIHGKADRQDCQIDIGIKALEQLWPKSKLVSQIKQFFNEEMVKIFQNYEFKGKKCVFNCETGFRGHWSLQNCTMATQAVQLGIPSFQVQLPKSVRDQLFSNDQLLQAFADGFNRLFKKIIQPWHELKNHKKLEISQKISTLFEPSLKTKFEVDSVMNEIETYHKKR